jgi:hypothetical protein
MNAFSFVSMKVTEFSNSSFPCFQFIKALKFSLNALIIITKMIIFNKLWSVGPMFGNVIYRIRHVSSFTYIFWVL